MTSHVIHILEEVAFMQQPLFCKFRWRSRCRRFGTKGREFPPPHHFLALQSCCRRVVPKRLHPQPAPLRRFSMKCGGNDQGPNNQKKWFASCKRRRSQSCPLGFSVPLRSRRERIHSAAGREIRCVPNPLGSLVEVDVVVDNWAYVSKAPRQ